MDEREKRLRRFDVALWRFWPSSWLPVVVVVEAADAVAAIVQVMQALGWTWAGHVAAVDLDGVLLHRAYGVRLVPVVVQETVQAGNEAVVQLPLIDNLEVMDRERG